MVGSKQPCPATVQGYGGYRAPLLHGGRGRVSSWPTRGKFFGRLGVRRQIARVKRAGWALGARRWLERGKVCLGGGNELLNQHVTWHAPEMVCVFL